LSKNKASQPITPPTHELHIYYLHKKGKFLIKDALLDPGNASIGLDASIQVEASFQQPPAIDIYLIRTRLISLIATLFFGVLDDACLGNNKLVAALL
jgi:hypothetical protein